MKHILACVLLLLQPLTSSAQDKMDYYRDLVQTFEDRVLPILIDRVSRSDRAILQNLDLQMIENPAVVTAVYTERDSKKVYIYAGFLDGLYNYVDCVLITGNRERRKSCDNYFEYYFDHVFFKKSLRPPLSFAEMIFEDNARLESWRKNSKMNEVKVQYMMSALTVIVMHEMGHHITGFAEENASISDRRKIEVNADKWAIDNLVRMNQNPITGAAMSLGYLSQMERFRRIKQVNSLSTHPMPKSRAEYALNKVCVGVLTSPMQKACDLIADLVNEFH